MKPIDVIRTKIDNDLLKYHNSTLCSVATKEDIIDIEGVGIMALVTPLADKDPRSHEKETQTYDGKPMKFPVIIANRPSGWNESDTADKYYVLILNPVQDRLSLSLGFLVPKTVLKDLSLWSGGLIDSKQLMTTNNINPKSKTIENIPKGGKG